jgi:hypothetical protein
MDPTKDMSDLNVDGKRGAEESEGTGETTGILEPRNKRRTRRGVKAKKGKEAAKLNKLQDGKTTGADEGMFHDLDWRAAHHEADASHVVCTKTVPLQICFVSFD